MCDVNITTGKLIRYEVDLYLPGFIPCEFVRQYDSTSSVRRALGFGWKHNWDIFLRWNLPQVLYHDADGAEKPLTFSPETGQARNDDEGLLLVPQDDGWLLDASDRRRYYFPPRDAAGRSRLAWVEDPNGNRLHLAYDAAGFLQTVTDTLGRQVHFRLDAAGRLTELLTLPHYEAEHLLVRVRYHYDDQDDLVAVEDSHGNAVRYEYQDHLLVRETDRSGRNVYWAYDRGRRCIRTWRDGGLLYRALHFHDRQRMVHMVNALGFSTIYRCDERANIVAVVDPLGQVQTNTYDAHGQLLASSAPGGGPSALSVFDEAANCLTETHASGVAFQYFFDDQNRLARIVDNEGHEWLRAYDRRGHLIRSVAPGGVEWQFAFAPQGYVARAINPQGHALHQERTPDGRITRLRDDLGPLLTTEYDFLGHVAAITNAAGRTTRFERDTEGRLVRITSADGQSRSCQYDAAGRLVMMADELGNVTRFAFDAAGKPIQEINALGGVLELTYDAESQLVAIRNCKGERAAFRYDPLGRLIETTFFDGQIERYEYDAASRFATLIQATGQRTTFAYDEAGDLVRKVLPDGQVAEFGYKDRFLLSAANADATVTREYDARLRLAKETQGDWEITYEYDVLDNLIRVADNRGRVATYRYDPRRRLTAVEDTQHGTHQWQYNELDLLVAWQMPNGGRQQLAYDELDRLVEITVADAAGRELLRRDFAYDAVDRLVREDLRRADTGEAVSIRYAYDPLHRLTEVVRDGVRVEWFHYDANGNITACADYASADIAAGNRVVRAGDMRCDYDPLGNLVARHEAGGTTRHEYNAAGQLTKVIRPDNAEIQFRYDPLGRRIGRVGPDGETRFYWNDRTPFREEAAAGTRSFLFLPSSFVLVGLVQGEDQYSVVFDQLGTPRELLDGGRTIVWSRRARAFGFEAGNGAAVACPLSFQGQYRDADSGLHYNYHRYYDPRLARFLTPDPIGIAGGTNLYRYVTNPKTWIDPYGLFELTVKARCDWNQQQMDDFNAKVDRYNQAIEEKQRSGEKGITISTCSRLKESARAIYEKCPKKDPNNDRPVKKSPKDQGKAVDCQDDIDHIIDVQMGGAQKPPQVCDNLVPVNASVNRSLGSQISNQLKNVNLSADPVLTKVKVGTRECPDTSPRTPACA